MNESDLTKLVARGLFADELLEEATRVTESGQTTAHGSLHALNVMWDTTKLEERKRCEERAPAIARLLLEASR